MRSLLIGLISFTVLSAFSGSKAADFALVLKNSVQHTEILATTRVPRLDVTLATTRVPRLDVTRFERVS